MEDDPSRSTVYFDGSCSLCRAEIGYYRRSDHLVALCFVDVSDADALVPAGLTPRRALERFHVRTGDGALLSGATAFIAVWARLPRWHWVARIATLPGMLALLKLSYRLFLPARPALAVIFGKVIRLRDMRRPFKRPDDI